MSFVDGLASFPVMHRAAVKVVGPDADETITRPRTIPVPVTILMHLD
jgi:hypothetical protein